MGRTQSLMRNNPYDIQDGLSIYIPTVGEIYDYDEAEYYRAVQLLTAMPYDLMVQFDDVGMDYESITEYQLFLMMLESFKLQRQDMSIIFGSLDLQELCVAENKDGIRVMIDADERVIINPKTQRQIAGILRNIHFLEKNMKKAGNEEAKKYLIERNRLKQKRAAKKQRSFLDDGIITLVNTEEFKYNYEQCMDLSIYKFNASLHQIPKKKNWEQTMHGAYFGTVDLSKLNMEKLHWMSATTG